MKIIFENIEIRLINQTKGNEFGQDLRFLRKIKDRLANMVRRKVKVKKAQWWLDLGCLEDIVVVERFLRKQKILS